jgi:hypothetical protein
MVRAISSRTQLTEVVYCLRYSHLHLAYTDGVRAQGSEHEHEDEQQEKRGEG